MIDMDEWRQRLAVLLNETLASPWGDEGQRRDLAMGDLAEAVADTPVADLRAVAAVLGVLGPPRSRSAVVESIVLAWAALPAAERAYPGETQAGRREAARQAGDLAEALSAAVGTTGEAEAYRRLSTLVEWLGTVTPGR